MTIVYSKISSNCFRNLGKVMARKIEYNIDYCNECAYIEFREYHDCQHESCLFCTAAEKPLIYCFCEETLLTETIPVPDWCPLPEIRNFI